MCFPLQPIFGRPLYLSIGTFYANDFPPFILHSDQADLEIPWPTFEDRRKDIGKVISPSGASRRALILSMRLRNAFHSLRMGKEYRVPGDGVDPPGQTHPRDLRAVPQPFDGGIHQQLAPRTGNGSGYRNGGGDDKYREN